MDETKKNNFEKKLIDILNSSALNLGLAIGYRHRLFDVMHALGRPASGGEIALEARVSRRYVEEWLGIMCTGRVVDLHADHSGQSVYSLPEEHAAFLCRTGDADMGVYTQEIPLLTDIALSHVETDFIEGRGIPFSAYPRFQEFMAELSHAKLRRDLADKFVPHVDAGQLIRQLETGIRVCDLGCGQGVAVHILADRWPASTFTGIDNHEDAIRSARTESDRIGLANTRFLIRDAACIKDDPAFAGQFDYIFAFDSIHDQSRPLEALRGIRHMLAPGGRFSMIDIDAASGIAGNMDHPMGPFLYTVSLMHCMPVGLNGNGAGLGMMWGRKKAVDLLHQAGFTDVRTLEMPFDPFNIHYFCRVPQ